MFEFECQQCGKCCQARGGNGHRTYMILSDEDQARIAAHFGLSIEVFCAAYEIKRGQIETTDKPCPWLGDDGRCSIHEVKPGYCAQWPYIKRHEKRHLCEETAEFCPGFKLRGE